MLPLRVAAGPWLSNHPITQLVLIWLKFPVQLAVQMECLKSQTSYRVYDPKCRFTEHTYFSHTWSNPKTLPYDYSPHSRLLLFMITNESPSKSCQEVKLHFEKWKVWEAAAPLSMATTISHPLIHLQSVESESLMLLPFLNFGLIKIFPESIYPKGEREQISQFSRWVLTQLSNRSGFSSHWFSCIICKLIM